MSLSKAIHDIGIIKGLQGHIDAANLALNCAGHRAASTGEWRAPTLTFEERDALDTIYALYKTQVEQVTFGEYERAFALANSRIRSRGVAVEVKAP